MILEVDCGNTLLKWRVLDGSVGSVVLQGAALCETELLAQLNKLAGNSLRKCRLVSVRGDAETDSLISALSLKYSMPVDVAKSGKALAGVTNGYLDHKLLGADRWLAIVGAFELQKSACLVLDVGTAVTADFVDASGFHLGGFICPGLKLLRSQLGSSTARVAYLAGSGRDVCNLPGKQTIEAVERGTELMLLGFIGTQVSMARDFWGGDCSILLTGGDAELVKLHFNEAITVPDLVFRGLALACPG